MRIRQAMEAGYLYRDPATGHFGESDRAAQRAAVDELHRVEASKREAESIKYANPVEEGIADISRSMAESGVDFTNELASWLGSEGNPAALSEPAHRWAGANNVNLPEQMAHYMRHLRQAVMVEVLQPRGIDPAAFMDAIEHSGLYRAAAVKAAMRAHVFRSLDAFHALADQMASQGIRYRQKRG
jgi:hypothetical protein